MGLPIGILAKGSVTIDGQEITFQAMSRSQALKLNGLRADPDAADRWVLVCGTGATDDEAEAFRSSHDADTAGLLVDAIIVLSGLAEPDDPKASRSSRRSSGRSSKAT